MADNEEKLTESAIPKRTIRLKPAGPAAAAASAPTLKLKSPVTPAPAPAADAAPVSTDTAKLARRTIKLVPQSGSPLSGPATAPATPVTPAVAPAPAASAPVSTDTAKLAKRTIKLTPASGAPAEPSATPAPAPAPAPAVAPAPAASAPVSTDTAKLAKRTIKLTPASGAPSGATPSAPTIKLHSPAAPSAPSAPTIKLHSPAAPAAPSAPSAPTIKLTNPQQAPESEVPTDTSKITRQPSTASSSGMGETVKLRPQSQQTIRLTPSAGGLQLKKPVEKTGLAAAEAPQELLNKMNKTKANENSPATVLFLVSSIVALLVIGITCFMMFAQYSNFFNGTDINVPGLERLTGSDRK